MKCVRAFRGIAGKKEKQSSDGGITMLSNSTALSAALKSHSNRCNTTFYNQLYRKKETEDGVSIMLLCDARMRGFYIVIRSQQSLHQNTLRVIVTCQASGNYPLSTMPLFLLCQLYTCPWKEHEETANSSSSTFWTRRKVKKNAVEEGGRDKRGVNKKMRGTSSHHLFLCCI